jgi:hypothetical protein
MTGVSRACCALAPLATAQKNSANAPAPFILSSPGALADRALFVIQVKWERYQYAISTAAIYFSTVFVNDERGLSRGHAEWSYASRGIEECVGGKA